ncbi:hypothetical protein DESUT3_33820 [Desulfuromonas versatilis]|uniref:Lipoprotein n=2 Tax=Desulfuromonas versatilis TaxID=2802975 RepID=A0ABN6E1Y2_9BACT|nr:hypothetical protein DESUT3_33820 [Desulfuromonas versatilis]
MNKQLLKATMLLSVLATLALTIGCAGNGQGRGPHGVPPEAIAACEGKSAGDSVKFTDRRGETLEATCQEQDGQLVAVPDKRPRGGGPR